MKTVVTSFKRASPNSDLFRRFALVLEIESRFRAVSGVAAAINKSFSYIRPTLLKSELDSAKKALHLLDTLTICFDANDVSRVDALDPITVEIKGTRYVRTAREASIHITTTKVVRMFEDIKAPLRLISSGVMDLINKMVTSLSAQELATAALSAIRNIV